MTLLQESLQEEEAAEEKLRDSWQIGVTMPTYENTHFGLRIDFPNTWRLTSWKNSKISLSWRSLYQTRDDDLPLKGPCHSKFLFTAVLNAPESECLVDADIEMSVHRLKPNEDFQKTLLENFERQRSYYETNGIFSSITKKGSWSIGGLDFGFVDEQSKTRKGLSRYRFFFRPVDKVYWLYGKIAGHKLEKFNAAIKIASGITWDGNRMG